MPKALCEMCGTEVVNPVNQPEMWEILVRQVQRRNIPFLSKTVCIECAMSVIKLDSERSQLFTDKIQAAQITA